MKKSFFYGNKALHLRPDPPGEPLYTFNELADKLGITPDKLKGLRMRHPGLEPWRVQHYNTLAGPAARWRLSDARKWFKEIPKEKVV